MATYYGTYGQKVQYLASDPSDPQIGQVWYNSTSAILKVRQDVTTNSWASGGALNTARYFNAGLQVGTQTAALIFGGFQTTGAQSASEKYNGTSWTNTPSLPTTKAAITGFGTQTAALGAGGTPAPGTTTVFSWDGSSWTTGTSMGSTRYGALSAGTQTAGLVIGGIYQNETTTEEWDGTNWTAGGTLNTNAPSGASAGTQTATLVFGGGGPPMSTRTELYNGTSWTTSPGTLNTARGASVGGAGTQTSALAFGGDTAVFTATAATEIWNGTTWTSNPTGLSTARSRLAGNGTQTAALASGGFNNTTQVSNTEEWSGIVATTKTVTVS